MTTHYQGRCVRITSLVFEARCPARRTFAIHDLTRVHTREVRVPAVPWSTSIRVCSSGLAGVAAVAATADWPAASQQILSAATAVLLITATIAATAASWGKRGTVYELRAVHRGRSVILFRCTDRFAFHQVRNALLTALDERGA